MKDNIWNKSFKAGDFKIKDLTLANNMELSILKDECMSFWVPAENGLMKIDVEKVKELSKTNGLNEFLNRAEALIEAILDEGDEVLASLKAYEVFFLIPNIWDAVREYKESLKKK